LMWVPTACKYTILEFYHQNKRGSGEVWKCDLLHVTSEVDSNSITILY